MSRAAALVEQGRREGLADACVLLVARRVNPLVTLDDWAHHLGVTRTEVAGAVARIKARADQKRNPALAAVKAPREPISSPCTHPGCRVVAVSPQGLAAHLRSHETVVCPGCGQTFNRLGLGPHRRRCPGQAA